MEMSAVDSEGMHLSEIIERLRTSGFGSTYDETPRGHMLGDVLEQMGYDGIIDYEVKRFGKWIPDDVVHVLAFHPRSLKSALGNRGTFEIGTDAILERRDGAGHGLSAAAARIALRKHFGAGIDAMISTGQLRLLDDDQVLDPILPEQVQDAMRSGRLKGLADKSARKVTLNPRSMRDAAELITSFYHEVGEHIGLEALLGRRGYRRLLARVQREAPHSPAIQAGINRLAFECPHLQPSHPHYWPEVIAYAGEQAACAGEGWWAQLKRGITRWLVRHDLMPRKLQDTDLQGLLHASAKAQLRGAMSVAVSRDRATFDLIGRGMSGPTREPELAQPHHAGGGLGLGLLR